jgi:hypothetical protein
MKRLIPLPLIGSAVVLCLAAGASQAAAPGLRAAVPAAAHASVAVKARWWHHRRCWWRHGHRHCRW